MAVFNTSWNWRDNMAKSTDQQGVIDQLILAIALGVGSFLTFCVLRPRWSSLYAARKRSKDDARLLPELPDSFFGWMLPLWRITDQQVLASAGLDAYVFLRFFKMASKYLAIASFFALAVIKPVHDVYDLDPDDGKNGKDGKGGKDNDMLQRRAIRLDPSFPFRASNSTTPDDDYSWMIETDYLWMYLVFAYLFSILMMYMIVANTRHIIEVRQEYLGSQTTITDRTIRLSGIPADLQSEEKIKQFMEELAIGKVENVTLCKNWSELDQLMIKRTETLRRLEAALVELRSQNRDRSENGQLPTTTTDSDDDGDDETRRLVDGNAAALDPQPRDGRPTATIRFGRFNLRSKKVDAVEYYQAQLKREDDRIKELRQSDFPTTPMAFVTMDTVAACQMAVQAVLDPSPLQLLANQSPAPGDVIWENTYLSRRRRMFRAWSITAVIVVLTLFWSILLIPLASLLDVSSLRKVIPTIGDWLKAHPFVRSIVENQLPTIVTSLLTAGVPYIYEWLANLQGMTSRGDVEMSLVSKNFFFTFFNFFIVFTALGTFTTAFALFQNIEKRLRNTTVLLNGLAQSLAGLISFYTNYLLLQALGLLPLKLLQVGSLSLYPAYKYSARTPRDYAELVQPATFSYGMFLPQTLLLFNVCLVYSVLKDSWKVLLVGLAYFLIGSFVYKYQLLYAMDQRQHSTGRSWIMMCDRVLVGLVVFQLTVSGQLLLKNIDARGALLLPLVIGTIWFSYAYNKTYRPLMQYIALKSVRRAEHLDPHYRDNEEVPEDLARWRDTSETRSRNTDHSREERGSFINPNLTRRLEQPWTSESESRRGRDSPPVEDAAESLI